MPTGPSTNAANDANAPPAERPSRPAGPDSLLIVAVAGMHSHACERTLVTALGGLAGVREVEVDFPSGQASIIYDGHRVAAHELLAGIRQAGYRPGPYHLGSGGKIVKAGDAG